MSPEKQRTAIAEACGWKQGKCPCGEELCSAWETPSGDNWQDPPDYLADLNAMHEAEKVLGDCEITWGEFRRYLWNIMEPHRHEIHATAAQRAEAFLRTVGKWEDGK